MWWIVGMIRPTNEKFLDLCLNGADTMFCEAPFLERDQGKSGQPLSPHRPSKQVCLGRKGPEVQRLVVFHFSPSLHRTEEISFNSEAHAGLHSTPEPGRNSARKPGMNEWAEICDSILFLGVVPWSVVSTYLGSHGKGFLAALASTLAGH